MITSKERAALRSQGNPLEVTLIVGKGGVSETLLTEAENLLACHELVKGRVLETALMTSREASDAICEALGAEGVGCVGSTFLIWKKSDNPERVKKAAEKTTEKKPAKKSGAYNPVSKGIRTRKQQAEKQRKEKKKYFHDMAVQAAIERRKEEQGK